MQQGSQQDLYRAFLDHVQLQNQSERRAVKRRMLNVFFWCFLLPALVMVGVILGVKFRILPRSMRGYLDWMVLIFPVFYSIYILSAEVLRDIPAAFRRGGIGSVLGQAAKESGWRQTVIEGLKRSVPADSDTWRWIRKSFEMDLRTIRYRTSYLTALAGAVFFLIMQGIDSITDPESVTWEKHPVLGWVETSTSDFSQFAGLALFLMLLYLSGIQTYHFLERYLNCVDLILADKDDEDKRLPSARVSNMTGKSVQGKGP